jgi:uncharacterized OB-fold protein
MTDVVEQTPIADGLFTWPSDAPQLIGGRCGTCGTVTFPRQGGCPRCMGTDIADHRLSRRGKLWTWTIQGFLPKSPPYAGPETAKTFIPYGVGYVALDDGVMVETRLTTADPDVLRIGMDMEMVVVPFIRDSDGREIVTFAFAPTGENPS